MGRCGGWIKGFALFLVALIIGCGDTGSNKSSSTGKPFVFQARGRLNLAVQVDPTDPKFLYITATLLDPQGSPFRNQRVTFEAEFSDAIFIPLNATETEVLACLNQSGTGNATRCTNRGAAITDDNGQAKVTLFAIVGPNNAPRNPNRLMRVIAEAPNSLDIASAISVPFTNAGFIFSGTLSIIPPEVTFVNPLVRPGTDGPKVTLSAQGGRPPYRWDNQNKDLGKITIKGQQNINEQAEYTLTGPINTDTTAALTDTILLNDALGAQVTAAITAVFADCNLRLSVSEITFGGARAGDSFDIKIEKGVGPFTATHTFPDAGTLTVNDATGVVTYTIPDPPFAVDPDTVLIRDSRGCLGSVEVSITPATPANVLLTADRINVCNTTAQTVNLSLLVTDSQNRPFDKTTILLTTTAGVLSQNTVTTGADGKASATLTLPIGTTSATVTATAASGGRTGTVTITGTATIPPCS